jgi:hypothetical protein
MSEKKLLKTKFFLATVSNEKVRRYRHIYEYILHDTAETVQPEPQDLAI